MTRQPTATAVAIILIGENRANLCKEIVEIVNRMFLDDARSLKQVPKCFKNATVSETELSDL
jgi:hypothetical protein